MASRGTPAPQRAAPTRPSPAPPCAPSRPSAGTVTALKDRSSEKLDAAIAFKRGLRGAGEGNWPRKSARKWPRNNAQAGVQAQPSVVGEALFKPTRPPRRPPKPRPAAGRTAGKGPDHAGLHRPTCAPREARTSRWCGERHVGEVGEYLRQPTRRVVAEGRNQKKP